MIKSISSFIIIQKLIFNYNRILFDQLKSMNLFDIPLDTIHIKIVNFFSED